MLHNSRYRNGIVAFACGLMFGIGLVLSGMANPAKVINFLDVFGNWDPSLAFVMGGAVAVTSVGFKLVMNRSKPALFSRFSIPTRKDIDGPLVIGAILFGIGWGISGYCPGPAWVALSSLAPGTLVFIVAMLAGMWLTESFKDRSS